MFRGSLKGGTVSWSSALSIAESGIFLGSLTLQRAQVEAKPWPLNGALVPFPAGAIVQRIEQAFPKR